MPGFFISNKTIDIPLINRYPEWCVSENLYFEKMTIKRSTLNKFMNDKVLAETEKLLIVVEGYILNKSYLLEKYQVSDVGTLVEKMYFKEGETFFNFFRGSFSGAVYDKNKNLWLVYTNHTGENAVFYSIRDQYFLVGSQVNYIIDACNICGYPLTFDEQAAYQMLTFAFMADNSTYANEIKRLRGGTYLRISANNIEVRTYYTLQKNTERFINQDENEIIEAVDKAFRKAVSLEYEKDKEYGYVHLSDLSGGLDSRIAMWVAHDLKKRYIQLITYCKANYMDEIIAKQIAEYWGDEILIKTLDDVSFLYDIDEIVFLNGGLSLYSGITGGKRMLESLNAERYGLEHTGMIGDAVVGSFCRNQKELDSKIPKGRYSDRLSNRLEKSLEENFEDHEIFLIYSRALQGAANTFLIRKNYTEAVSPFMNIDFLQLCMDIPLSFRKNHRLYKKWILKKYPQAAKFRWEKTGMRIDRINLLIILKKISIKCLQKLLKNISLTKNIKTGMNPLDYWISKNNQIRLFMNEYEENGYKYFPKNTSEQLKRDMRHLYTSGNALEKTMVLTVLAAVKLYFGKFI